ncbi:MAG: hypothetical protein Q9228_005239 [Teloschistes exilis]
MLTPGSILLTQVAPASKEDDEMIALSKKCSAMAHELQREIEKLRIDKGRHRQAVLQSGLAIWKMPKLKGKQSKLEKYKQILDTQLLVRLDSKSLKQSCDLGSLDRSVQDLAAKLDSGLKTTDQKSVAGLLRSLLYQIAAQWEGMVDLSSDDSDDPGTLELLRTWTDQRLLSTLKRFLDQKPTTVVFCTFIDGLDEIAEDEDQLLEIIGVISDSPGCKVCVSSWPEQIFRQEFRECRQLRVQDLNAEDLTKMALEILKPCLGKNMPDSCGNLDLFWFVENLVHKAEGVFLWLNLMIKDIIRGANHEDTIDELSRRIKNTPATINGLYQQMLQRLDPEYLSDAFFFLRYCMILRAGSELDIHVSLLGLICADDTNWEYVKNADRAHFCELSFDGICKTFHQRLIGPCGGFIDISDDQGPFEGSGLRSYQPTVDSIGQLENS